ncbi:TIR domain-containing protein [Brevibacillus sp. SAFN-007a]|uniref:TIR domain-containing protein n=1 Tax=Brevibacillus sp. SAFN-007a TaxID=3436862 RepID=UPI003F817250
MGNQKGIIINGGNFTVTNLVNGDQINYNSVEKKPRRERDTEQYEVIFSFAGEQRESVKEVARILSAKKVSVFYDESEQINLWGKNLKEQFQRIFGFEGFFCVVFVSSDYMQKRWCRMEKEIMEAREAKANREYILPITLDGTMIPDWEDHKAFLDGRNKSAQEIADAIFQKLYLEYKQ